MAEKVITGSYPSGYALDPAFQSLRITSSASVGGSGVTTSASQSSTISNAGTVAGTQNGITLSGGGSITNTASISGVAAIVADGGPASVDNRSAISSTRVQTAYRKFYGEYSFYRATYAGPSVILKAGGDVTNTTSAGTISNGISISGGSGSVVNRGTIGAASTDSYESRYGQITSSSGSEGNAIRLTQGGTIANGANGATGAMITGGVSISGALGSVTNNGTIDGSSSGSSDMYGRSSSDVGTAVTLQQGGTVKNGTGRIAGVTISGARGIVTNDGLINGGGSASSYFGHYGEYADFSQRSDALSVTLSAGGTLTNGSATNSSAQVSQGISIAGGAGRVMNYGAIAGAYAVSQDFRSSSRSTSIAVVLEAGGTVFNAASGTIGGVVISGGTGGLTNLGAISGATSYSNDYNGYSSSTTSFSADFRSGGGIVNGSATNATAALSNGVSLSGNGSLTNFGAIGSNSAGVAVMFTDPGATLIEEGTGTLTGLVQGGGGSLVLARDAGAGTIGGIGSTVTGFSTITVQSGATWTVTGTTAIAATTTFENDGQLTFTGVVTNDGTLIDKRVIDLGAAGQILDATDGTFVLDGNAKLVATGRTSGYGLRVSGVLEKSGAGTASIGVTSLFTDAAKIRVSSGILQFTGKTTSIAADVSGAGTLAFGPGTATLAVGASITTGGLQIGGSGAHLIADTTLSYSGSFKQTAGSELTVDAGDTFTLRGTTSLSGATLDGTGRLTLRGDTTFGAVSVEGVLSVVNYGTTRETGNLALGGGTRFVNQAGASFELAGNVGILASTTRFSNNGSLVKTAGAGKSTIGVDISNFGTVEVQSGSLAFAQDVLGSGGTLRIDDGTTLEFDATVAAGQTVAFGSGDGELMLKDAHDFAASISGFDAGDTIDLRGFAIGSATISYDEADDGNSGVLKVKSGTNSASLSFVGQYDAAGFHIANDRGGGIDLTYAAPQGALAGTTIGSDPAFAHALFEGAFGSGAGVGDSAGHGTGGVSATLPFAGVVASDLHAGVTTQSWQTAEAT